MTSTVSALYHFSIGTFGFFLQDLAVVAVQCMCKLLTTHPHFNYRSDVITFLVPLMTHRHSKVSPGPQCVCTVLRVFCVCLCVSSVCMSSVSVCVCKHPKVTHGLLHHSGCVLCLFMYVQCVCLCVRVCRHPKVQFWFPAPQCVCVGGGGGGGGILLHVIMFGVVFCCFLSLFNFLLYCMCVVCVLYSLSVLIHCKFIWTVLLKCQ